MSKYDYKIQCDGREEFNVIDSVNELLHSRAERIEELENQVSELESRIDELETELANAAKGE